MSIVGYFISLITSPNPHSIVEIYDRVTEDGLYRRKTEQLFTGDGLDDRETEGAS
tara:strand:+ start:594 stop:758 length:165 start_codon:yes stop_codon:yes gene_type:complete